VFSGFPRVLFELEELTAFYYEEDDTMAQAKTGDTVKVHYTGKLADGTVFDTSADREPLQFTIGQGQLIPDFEQAVIGMETEESKTIQIPADKAYGPHREEMLMEVERSRLPKELDPKVDQKLQMHHPNGQSAVVSITKVTDTHVTLDANHPLAGKDLTFDIQLTEIA
jgi:FKBP-type peptidyl-prolyl cis-trans isomerase 2